MTALGVRAWEPDASPTPPPATRTARALPTWPFTCLCAGFPLWWAIGLADVVLIPVALVMALYLAGRGRVRVPHGFALWLVFLFFMLCSIVELVRGSQYITFGYRAACYLATTVVLLYVYNARSTLTDRRVLTQLSLYWMTVVGGGFLGMVAPSGALKTPMYYVVSSVAPGLLGNDLVKLMVVRPFAQYDPNGYFQVPPRPAAPFLFTNNWGNAYSLLLPLVLVLLVSLPARRRLRRLLILLLPLSAVPAMMTLNRGMVIGLAIALVWASLRLAARGNFKGLTALGLLAVVGGILWFVLPIQAGLSTRTEVSTSTRASLYTQSLQAAAKSPFFGYGTPVDSKDPLAPPVGTQGQFWLVLVSHGTLAALCFVAFFLVLVLTTMRRRDLVGVVGNAVLLAGSAEIFFYGLVPDGLLLMMAIAGLAARPPTPEAPLPPPRRGDRVAEFVPPPDDGRPRPSVW